MTQGCWILGQLQEAHRGTTKDKTLIAQLQAATTAGGSSTAAATAELKAVRETAQADAYRAQARITELESMLGALERELTNADAVATARVREAEAGREAAQFAASQAEGRVKALDAWRQRETAKANRAEVEAETARLDVHRLQAELKSAHEKAHLVAVPLREEVGRLTDALTTAKQQARDAAARETAAAAEAASEQLKLREEIKFRVTSVAPMRACTHT